MEWFAYALGVGFWTLFAILVVCIMVWLYIQYLAYKTDDDALIERVCDAVIARLDEIEKQETEIDEN